MAQLDGSDIVYLARVAVPKLISLRVDIGTRFPAMVTSQGRALLSAMDRDSVHERLSEPLGDCFESVHGRTDRRDTR